MKSRTRVLSNLTVIRPFRSQFTEGVPKNNGIYSKGTRRDSDTKHRSIEGKPGGCMVGILNSDVKTDVKTKGTSGKGLPSTVPFYSEVTLLFKQKIIVVKKEKEKRLRTRTKQ